jgi:hypothetical protein
MLQALPVELQRHCISFVEDSSTLRSLRFVNKASAALAAEPLFHTFDLRSAEPHAERYASIARDAKLSSLVRNVVFRSALHFPQIFQDEIPRELEDALSLLPSFQRVGGVQLTFSEFCSDLSNVPGINMWGTTGIETVAFRTKVLVLFFEAVAKSKCVQSLTIQNLQDYTSASLYERQAFQTVRNRLKKLHLCILITHNDVDNIFPSYLLPEMQIDFIKSDLFTHWLGPTQAQLTHLTLYTTCWYWGVYPFCDLRSVFFPRLDSLALGCFTIAHDWQVDWILSHGSTLKSLVLDDCPVAIALCMEPRHYENNWVLSEMNRYEANSSRVVYTKYISIRWAAVLTRFRTSLPKLRHFAMGRNKDLRVMFEQRNELVAQIMWGRYVIFDCLLKFSPWVRNEAWMDKRSLSGALAFEFPGDEEDTLALSELVRVVNGRA